MQTWIDFKELRQRLSFEAVLRHFGVEPRLKGKQHHGFCPLPNHQGKRNSASFSANVERGIFQCFGCGAKGNILDFAVLMSGKDPTSTADVHSVAVELHERFVGPMPNEARGRAKTRPSPPPAQPSEPTADNRPRVINAPLDFELKSLDAAHPYLRERGFTSETIAHFGLGYCSRGMLKGRIAIPLHNTTDGKLIGYAGRLVNESEVSEDEPKYRLPPKRERKGVLFEFQKTRLVYNGNRIRKPVDDLVVVEGFPSVWWLWQCGIENVVAVMGASCAERQAELIVGMVTPSGRVWAMPDGNAAGERCAESIIRLISPHRFVRWIKLDADKQPTDLSPESLRALLTR
ncbi:toprim domain-containing protein [bacterium]|nr:toprim domain-containing protein [bacterium]